MEQGQAEPGAGGQPRGEVLQRVRHRQRHHRRRRHHADHVSLGASIYDVRVRVRARGGSIPISKESRFRFLGHFWHILEEFESESKGS